MGWTPQTSKRLADGTMQHYPGNYRCRVGHKDHDACNVNGRQVGTPYDEVGLLERLHDFRWEERYSSTTHDEELTKARQHLIALEEVQGEKQRTLDNIKQGIKDALKQGIPPNDPTFVEARNEADAELVEAENAVAIADRQYIALKSKAVGKTAAREARAKVKAFMDSRLDTYEEREKFNEWFHGTGLVVLVDPRTRKAHLGMGSIQENRLVGYEPAEGALAALISSEWIVDGISSKRIVDGKVQKTNPFLEDLKSCLNKFRETGQMERAGWEAELLEQIRQQCGDEPWFQEIVNNPSKLPTFAPTPPAPPSQPDSEVHQSS